MESNSINVNLLFQADTTAALSNINQLANILNQIAHPQTIGVSAGPISEAANAAKQLQLHLSNAMNTDTGKIDLLKFNQSLKVSNTSLQDLTGALVGAGTQGQQAFVRLATAINQAERPMMKLSANVTKFLNTLGNTALWTIASNGIHAIQSGIQSAFSYAENLNKSLTDIRIVTGYSKEYMADFAKEAASAASALNTTTSEYTKASLIFFQQGLSGDDVKERVETVIKLSQVTGESAATVSDQMTAIWNNFDDGTQKLEYYADAIAKLGAATAASTDEIVAGVEKFAAIADNVGLSFEYATASLATVVDQTKQSPEVIGTAFKTIFARLQGLKLGETLEDGTDLNKYSEALQAVGIEIKTADGQLKDMDNILDELGEKWKILGKDAQIALAQTVGGLRQYNQMIALMDNYDVFKENVALAENSSGELQAQANIFKESWEGASLRVEEKINKLFSNLINDKSVIELIDMFGELIDMVNNFITSIGGFGPMITSIALMFSSQLFPIIWSGLSSAAGGIGNLLGLGQRRINQIQETIRAEQQEKIASGELTEVETRQLEVSMMLADKKRELMESIRGKTELEKQEINNKIKLIEVMEQEIQKSLELQQVLEAQAREQTENVVTGTGKRSIALNQDRFNNVTSDMKGYSETQKREFYDKALTTSEESLRKQIKKQDNNIKEFNETKPSGPLTPEAERELKNYEKLRKELQIILELKMKINNFKSTNKSTGELEQIEFGQKTTLMDSDDFEDDNSKKYAEEISKSYTQKDGQNKDVFAGATHPEGERLKDESGSVKKTGALDVSTNVKNFKAAKQEAGKYNQITKTLSATQSNLQKITDKYNKELKEAGDNTKKQQKATDKYKKSLDQMKKGMEKVQKTMGLSGKTTEETSKNFDNLINKDLGKGIDTDVFNNINNDMTALINTSAGTRDSFDTMADGMGNVLSKAGYSEEELNKLGKTQYQLGENAIKTSQDLEGMEEAVDSSGMSLGGWKQSVGASIQGVATLAGSCQMLMSSLSMLNAAFDEDATAVERWQSGLMGISLLLPTVVTIFSSLNTALTTGIGAKITDALVTGILAKATKKSKDEIRKMTDEQKKAEIQDIKSMWAKIKLTIAQNLWLGLAALAVIAIIGGTQAMIKDTKATKENTKSIEEQNAAKEENTKKTKETTDKLLEETTAIHNLIDAYNKLADAGKKTTDVEDQIKEKIPDLIKQYNELKDTLSLSSEEAIKYAKQLSILEGVKLGTLSIEEAETALMELENIAAKKTKDQFESSNKTNQAMILDKWSKQQKKGYTYNKDTGEVTIAIGGADADNSKEEEKMQNALQTIFGDKAKNWGKSGKKYSKDGSIGTSITLDVSTPEATIETIEKLTEAKKNFEENASANDIQTSGMYDEIVQLLNETQEYYNTIKENTEISDKVSNLEAFNAVTSSPHQKTNQIVEITTTEALKSEDFFTRDGKYYKYATAETMQTEDIQNYSDYKNFRDRMVMEKLGEGRIVGDGSVNFSGVDQDKLKEAQESVNQYLEEKTDTSDMSKVDQMIRSFEENKGTELAQKLADQVNNLTDDQVKVFLDADLSGVEEITPESFQQILADAIDTTALNENFNTILNGVFKGEIDASNIAENEAFVALQKDVEKLGTVYPELEDKIKTFNNTALIGTEQWRSAVLELQSEVNKLNLDKKFKEYQKAYDEFEEKWGEEEGLGLELQISNLEEFQTDLDKLLEKDYAINIEIHTQAQQVFDNVMAMQDEMAEAAKNIGEDYIISANQMQEINKVFPGILEGYKKLEDGSIQLNKTQVKMAMDTAKKTAEEDKKALVEKLQNMLTELDSKYEIYEQMYQAASDLASGNIKLSDYETKIKKGYSDLEDINSTISAKNQAGDNKSVADDAKVNAGITAENWTSGYKEAAEAANEFAKIANNANAVAAGQSQEILEWHFKNGYEGKDGKTAESLSDEKIQEEIAALQEEPTTLPEWLENSIKKMEFAEEQKQYWKNMMDQNRETRNDIDGMLKEAEARTWEDSVAYDNIAAGEGADGPDEDKDKDKDPHDLSEKAKDNQIFRGREVDQEIDRFEDNLAVLDKLEQKLNKISRAKEEAWGMDYINAIEQENAALQDEIKEYEKLEKEAKDYMQTDLSKARNLGLTIDVDSDGMITNKESIAKQIFEAEQALEKQKIDDQNALNIEEDTRLNALLGNDDATNELRDQVTKDIENKKRLNEETYAAEEDRIEKMKGWYENYEEAYEQFVDSQEQKEEKLAQIRSNNLEKLQYKYDKLKEMQDQELQLIENIQSNLSESFKEAPEFFDLMAQKFENITNNGEIFENRMKEALSLFGARQISKAGLIEEMDNAAESAGEWYQAVMDYNEEMKESYVNFFNDFRDQLDKASEDFDHLISLTENYESILGLMGKEKDYTSLGGLYKQRETVAKASYESSVKNYQFYLDEYQRIKQEYDAADEEGQKVLQSSLDETKAAVHESQQTMLEDAEAWLESMQLIRDNAIAAAGEALEKGLFGGKTADEMNDYMESLKAKTEDYLTETNQQYETQKMIRTAMRDLEKTENEAAKKKLDNFRKETEELQKQSRLSNFELEIQQAKYELLLAEIALQEAQDAKSTVRLRRDAEGNFNYVYTADQDKVAEAQQKYEDAENKLYNVRLNGANEFAEKRVSLELELKDKLLAIAEDQTLSEEERAEKSAALKEEYFERIKDAQSIYNIASEQLGDQLSEAWSTDMMDMIGSTAEMEIQFETYIGQCDTAYKNWQISVDTASTLIEENYGNVEEAVGKVTTAVEKLRTDGAQYLAEAAGQVTQWANISSQMIKSVKDQYQEVLTLILSIKEAQGGVSKDINYMAQYQASGTVSTAFQKLIYREQKLEKYPGYWEDNITELMKEVNNEHTYIENATSLSEAFAAASRREAKLEYLKRADISTYNYLKDNFASTKELLTAAYTALGASPEEIQKALADIEKEKTLLDSIWAAKDMTLEDLAKSVGAFDTGGYTGDFGPEGRVALLHEKELVLNKQDTENLLDTIDIVRDLINSLEYNNLLRGLMNFTPAMIDTLNPKGDFLEQEVTIHAEFPNVQDRHEIEDAIENLVLTASQFANRKS